MAGRGIFQYNNPKPIKTILKEMLGRTVQRTGLFENLDMSWAFGSAPTFDFSHVNYFLTRAVYYASEYPDPLSGKVYGRELLLGAGFGKPIVNACAAFTIGKLPNISIEGDYDDEAREIEGFFSDNHDTLFRLVRNGLRDGDSYFRLWPDLSMELVPAFQIEEIHNDVSGDIEGYNITTYRKGATPQETIKQVESLRTAAPTRYIMEYKANDKRGTEIFNSITDDEEDPNTEGARLPVIAFHNEPEDEQIYGNSEYQNAYIYMLNYHAILENATKNNIFNSNALPYVSGVTDVDAFKRANGKLMSDGSYKIRFDPSKMLLGGQGFSVNVAQSIQNSTDASALLNIYFYLMCQSTQTPEFIFGTAVQSSKASVSEQMPIAIAKAEQKQNQLKTFFRELVVLYGQYKSVLDSSFNPEFDFDVKWQPILDKDMKLNVQIVTALDGIISDRTKAIMLGIDEYVEDIDAEIKSAQDESMKKVQQVDKFFGQSRQNPTAELTQEEQAVATTPAK